MDEITELKRKIAALEAGQQPRSPTATSARIALYRVRPTIREGLWILIHGMPPGPPCRFRSRLDNLAHDCVDQPHTVLFAVTNQRLRHFAVTSELNCLAHHQ